MSKQAFKPGDLWVDKTTGSYWRFNGVRWIFMGNLRAAGAA